MLKNHISIILLLLVLVSGCSGKSKIDLEELEGNIKIALTSKDREFIEVTAERGLEYLNKKPDNIVIRKSIITLYIRLKDYKSVISQIDILKRDSPSTDYRIIQAILYEITGDVAKSRIALEDILSDLEESLEGSWNKKLILQKKINKLMVLKLLSYDFNSDYEELIGDKDIGDYPELEKYILFFRDNPRDILLKQYR